MRFDIESCFCLCASLCHWRIWLQFCLHVSHQVWLLPVLQAVKVSPLIEKVSDHKDFKKLLRTRTNVLVLYTKTGRWTHNISGIFYFVRMCCRIMKERSGWICCQRCYGMPISMVSYSSIYFWLSPHPFWQVKRRGQQFWQTIKGMDHG